ncbi:MAG: TauD/TfdA family dioxygenase [Bacteroidota bacterium]
MTVIPSIITDNVLRTNISKSFLAGKTLPLVVQPAVTGIDLGSWLQENSRLVKKNLHRYGGILFRGFGVDKVEKFDALMANFNTEVIPYMFRSSPRYALSDKVYVSTTYPNDRKINMHSESSYSYAWGRKIFFCCIKAAERQGETPIADNRRVLARLEPALAEKFERLGVIYQRNLSPHAGLPWQEVFQTEDPAVVQQVCKANKVKFKFKSPEALTIMWKKPAIYRHPETGEKIWFNHSFFFNKFSLFEEMGLDPDAKFPGHMLSSNTFFGDGSKISFAEYSQIKAAYDEEIVRFPWEEGDLLMLDNMLAAHGRSPYEGERKIVVSIIEPYLEAK